MGSIQYYVRRNSYNNKEYQKGAFEVFDNAKKCCDKYPGYNVYNAKGETVYMGEPLTTSYITKNAVNWAKATANNNKHGYDNTKKGRGGNPDFACSSFVNEAYRQAGVILPISSTVYTAKMRKIYLAAGFEDVTSKVNLKTGKGLVSGDVVLSPGLHVEIYVGNGKLAGARGNANSGRAENGKTGDQTGGEITVSGYWNYPWKYVLRYKGTETENVVMSYLVQAGFYYSKDNAVKTMNNIKDKGINAIVKSRDGGWFVQLGIYNKKSNAEKMVAKAAELGFKAIIKEM